MSKTVALYSRKMFWRRLAKGSLSCHYIWTLSSGASPAFAFPGHVGRKPIGRSFVRPSTSLFSTANCVAPSPEEIQMIQDSKPIVEAAIQAVNPEVAVKNRLNVRTSNGRSTLVVDGHREYNLENYDKLQIVAFGKASSAMAVAVLDRLLEADTPSEILGAVVVKDDHATDSERQFLEKHNIRVFEASHPVPDERSVQASREILELVRSANERTLVIACISGGGSALFCAPHESLSLDDLQATNTALLQSGWNIQDMNVVRKRLDQGKGGRLAEAAYPGQIMSLILSDVLGDPLDLIASGPTVPDTSTWQDAWDLVQRLPTNALPSRVISLLKAGNEGSVEDSPAGDHPVFQDSHNSLVGNNAVAVLAAAEKAKGLGYHPIVLGTQLEGEASEVARVLVSLAQHARHGPEPYSAVSKFPAALIVGGETVVSLPTNSNGKGGRNQELALQAAILLKSCGLRQVVLTSVGTDGSDGPTDAAGGVVDGCVVARLPGNAVKALRNHDAYPYLEQCDADGLSPLLKTGPTGTNVADIYMILIHSRA